VYAYNTEQEKQNKSIGIQYRIFGDPKYLN